MSDSTANQRLEKVPKKVLDSAYAFAKEVQVLLPESDVYLFGSQVKGTATDESDIDIAIVCEDLGSLSPEQYREIRSDLWYVSDFIDSCIEPHLISARHEHSGFLGEIVSTGFQIT